MPGQAKIDSVTTENASSEPNSRPITVTTGIMMFFNTCTPTTRMFDRPLARAKRT